jgi:hypothetical protein
MAQPANAESNRYDRLHPPEHTPSTACEFRYMATAAPIRPAIGWSLWGRR